MKLAPSFNPKLICLSVNSARGSLLQAQLISSEFQKVSESLGIAYYTFAEDVAMGAGYALLSSGTKAFADPHSLIGGISASLQGVSLVNFVSKFQVKPKIISSGDNKVRLSPFEEVSSKDQVWVEELLAKREALLKEVVLRNRPGLEEKGEVFGGEAYSGKQALDLELVDYIGEVHTQVEEEFPDSTVVEKSVKARDGFQMGLEELGSVNAWNNYVNEWLDHKHFEVLTHRLGTS